MAQVIRFHQTGGPEVLRLEELELGEPGPGEVQVRQSAVGVDFVDIYQRRGLYKLPLPSALGGEAAGVVVALGAGVSGFKVGDRVVYLTGALGAYATARNVGADRVVKLPERISDREAAGMMLKGLTAWYLIRKTFPVQRGQTVLWHAAAGGVGLIACQWLKSLGVTVIGTAGSEEKAALARSHGCAQAIVYTSEDWVARVRELSGGAGLPVVFDSVGKTTFQGSLDVLAPRGMLVSFGNASGPVGLIDPLLLSQRGSLYFTRPTLGSYTSTRAELEEGTAALFERVLSGAVKIEVSATYPLAQAAQAQTDLESRKTTGSIVLLP